MEKEFNSDLILTEDTTFNESIKVNGNIKGYFNLIVKGDIYARDINAGDITAKDIDAGDITAWDINAGDITAWDINAGDITAWDINAGDITAKDIDAGDIDARDIICEKRIKKIKENKTICRVYVKNRSKFKRKEQEMN